jgi:hypothetical protein
MLYRLKHIRSGAMLSGCLDIFVASDATALKYRRVPLEPLTVAILARGPIVLRDYQRLGSFLREIPPSDRIVGLFSTVPAATYLRQRKSLAS